MSSPPGDNFSYPTYTEAQYAALIGSAGRVRRIPIGAVITVKNAGGTITGTYQKINATTFQLFAGAGGATPAPVVGAMLRGNGAPPSVWDDFGPGTVGQTVVYEENLDGDVLPTPQDRWSATGTTFPADPNRFGQVVTLRPSGETRLADGAGSGLLFPTETEYVLTAGYAAQYTLNDGAAGGTASVANDAATTEVPENVDTYTAPADRCYVEAPAGLGDGAVAIDVCVRVDPTGGEATGALNRIVLAVGGTGMMGDDTASQARLVIDTRANSEAQAEIVTGGAPAVVQAFAATGADVNTGNVFLRIRATGSRIVYMVGLSAGLGALPTEWAVVGVYAVAAGTTFAPYTSIGLCGAVEDATSAAFTVDFQNLRRFV